MFAFIDRYRSRAAQAERERGFNYAAGMLLRGATLAEVLNESDSRFGPTRFEAGMRAALIAWGQTVVQEPT